MKKENEEIEKPSAEINHRHYQNEAEGKAHYARLSAQNSWLEEDAKLSMKEEEEEYKRLELHIANAAKEHNESSADEGIPPL